MRESGPAEAGHHAELRQTSERPHFPLEYKNMLINRSLFYTYSLMTQNVVIAVQSDSDKEVYGLTNFNQDS